MRDGLQRTRLRLHASVTLLSALGSGVVCAVVLAMEWRAVPHSLLLSWAVCLLAGLALRVGVWWAHVRALEPGIGPRSTPAAPAAPPAQVALWLGRYRLSFLGHGLAWGVAAALLPPYLQGQAQTPLTFALAALAAGSLITAAFDLRAAALFVVPAMLPMVSHLFWRGDTESVVQGALLLLFLGITGLSALRTQRILQTGVRLRLQQTWHAVAAAGHAEQAEAARRALAEQHHLMGQLLRTTRQGYWRIDTAGVGMDVNPAMCLLLGRPREEIVGRSVFDFFTGEDRRLLEREVASRHAGVSASYEVSLTRPDGTRLHCMNHASPIEDTQGVRVGSVGLWTDISVRREAEGVLRSFELVVNSITDLVSVVDEHRIYRLVNDAWCKALGLSREQALGRSTDELLPEGGGALRRQALAECLQSQQVRKARAALDGRGQGALMFETTYYPYVSQVAGERLVAMVTRDVTEQENSRLALEASAEYLRRTLDATGDAIFASDATSPGEPVRFVNAQMLRLWNIPQSLAAGLTPADIMAHALPMMAEPEREARLIQDVIKENRRHESQVPLRDGRLLLRRCEPAQVGAHSVRVWSFRDVTAETRALQLLQDRDAEQRALLDAFPGYIDRLDTNLVYRYVNRRHAALLGLTPEQVVGRSVADVMGPAREAELRVAAERALAGETVNFEFTQPTGAGRPVMELQITLAAGVDPHSGAPAIFGFGIDISGRKRAERALHRSEAELRALLEAFPGYIAALDDQLRYTYINERMAEVLGEQASALIGRSVGEVQGESRSAAVAGLFARTRAGERVVQVRSFPRPGHPDERLDLEMTHVAGPVGEGGHQTGYAFGVDITARLRAELQLIGARDEAQRANQAKSQFLSQMSHELRTPMNAILGFGQLLESDPRQALAPHQQRWVEEILRGARHLLDLINEILDLGRIEAGQLQIHSTGVDLEPLVCECLALVRPLAPALGLQLQAQTQTLAGVRVAADSMRLRQVLLNLLGNAIKYNRPGGQVSVACEVEAAQVRLLVRDTGRGLSEGERARLFQPFERIHATDSAVEGTGIGLALSRRLVEAMGGSIGVHSTLGMGSTFWVRLPRAAAADAPPAHPGPQADLVPPVPAAPVGTVLYIEDNAINLALMEAMLSRLSGVRLLATASPAEGLQLAQTQQPALVLLDIQLPGTDGFEVLSQLRAEASTSHIPVIAVSANALAGDIDAALAAGFAGYLTKPLELDLLLRAVCSVLECGVPPGGRAGAL
jgi:PAS domain S-box-containing protein